MAYTPFDQTTPDPSTQNGTLAFDSTRENTIAVRDGVLLNGFFPGWAGEAQNSDGSTPPLAPEKPEQWVFSKGSEQIKAELTWGTSGGSKDNIVAMIFSYSSDSGVSWDLIADTAYPLGTVNIAYDSNSNVLSWNWS